MTNPEIDSDVLESLVNDLQEVEIDMIGSQYPFFRQAGLLCCWLTLFLAPVVARSFLEARSHLESAKQLLGQQSTAEAINDLRRAIEWRGFGNPAPLEAQQLLRAISENYSLPDELRRDAVESLKSGLRSSRSWLHPSSYSDPHSDASLLRDKLLSQAPNKGPARAFVPPRLDVHYGWQFAAQVTFWGWVVGLAHLAFFSVTRDGSIATRQRSIQAALVATCYVLWLVSLRFA